MPSTIIAHGRNTERRFLIADGLSWERLDNRRASRVATYRAVPDDPPLDENTELQGWAISTMVRWNDVLRPIIRQLVADPVRAGSGPDPA